MPARDGSGPRGQGPMTGRGMGFCVLKSDPCAPETAAGFAGKEGMPVTVSAGSIYKEVNKMPGGDGTGPMGMGPMTGRAAGFCAGYPAPGYVNSIPGRGFGFGRGRGFGFGRGLGLGFRGGRGPFGGLRAGWGGYLGAPYGAAPTPQQETDMLKGQAEYFEDALEGIRKRIADLESEAAKK